MGRDARGQRGRAHWPRLKPFSPLLRPLLPPPPLPLPRCVADIGSAGDGVAGDGR